LLRFLADGSLPALGRICYKHHRKNYLERKREIRALEWVLLKFQSPFFNKSPSDNQPAVSATEKTLDTE
jgi:hypothetical protein